MLILFNSTIFGGKLRDLRKKHHVSQKALATQIGVSVYSIRGWESGTVEPMLSYDVLNRLCQVLDTTSEQLSGADILTGA